MRSIKIWLSVKHSYKLRYSFFAIIATGPAVYHSHEWPTCLIETTRKLSTNSQIRNRMDCQFFIIWHRHNTAVISTLSYLLHEISSLDSRLKRVIPFLHKLIICHFPYHYKPLIVFQSSP